ncbi:hypothetical protein J4411_01505 [Candidatus Pacearchaeota archaeon]|nr:hypothetical protein [Candidatus Pacearchaeota archaeon]
MTRRKNIRERGKIRFSEYFKSLKDNDTVAVKREISVASHFPKRLQGRTGTVKGKRGRSYLIKLKDQEMEKEYLIESVHLKKLNRAVKK